MTVTPFGSATSPGSTKTPSPFNWQLHLPTTMCITLPMALLKNNANTVVYYSCMFGTVLQEPPQIDLQDKISNALLLCHCTQRVHAQHGGKFTTQSPVHISPLPAHLLIQWIYIVHLTKYMKRPANVVIMYIRAL